MNDFDYIKERFKEQLCYYDRRAKKYQRYYQIMCILIIIISPIPMVLLSFADLEFIPTLIIVLASYLTTILSSIVNFLKFHDFWISYRSTEQELRREYVHFLTETGEYKNLNHEQRMKLFITRCEELMGQERSKWLDKIQQQDLSSKNRT